MVRDQFDVRDGETLRRYLTPDDMARLRNGGSVRIEIIDSAGSEFTFILDGERLSEE